MTPRSLFKIILKIFGLFFLREIIKTVPQFVVSIVESINNGSITEGVFSFAINVIVILFYGFIVAQLLFNTTNILDKFKLDQGFDEEEFSFEQESKKGQFAIGITANMILMIALSVLAGIILVNEIPNLCKEIYLYITNPVAFGVNNKSYIVFAVVKILIALLFIGERKRIIEFVGGKQTIKDDEKEEKEDKEEQ
jgi:cytochrome b subunit of formate dehydrogenase